MNDPQRLKDDPGFLGDTGCDLAAESLVVGGYDLGGLKVRVLQGGTPPVPPSTPWWKVFFASAGTAAMVSFAIAFLVRPGPIATVPPLSPAPIQALATGPAIPSTRRVEGVEIETPIEVPAVATTTPQAPPSDEVVAPPSTENERQPPSGLVVELADYNRALDARDQARWAEAALGYQAYLERWPAGRLRTESRLGLLSALVGGGKTEQAAELAARLTADPTLSHKHAELTLVRAEALVELGRCDEALGLVDGLKRSSRSTAVKQACRKQRR